MTTAGPAAARGWLPRAVRDLALAGPAGVLLAVLVVVPLVLLGVRSVTAGDDVFALWRELGRTDLYMRLLGRSLAMAAGVTLLTVAVAWPAGWAISRARPRHRPVLLMLAVIPYLTSYLLLIYAVLVLLSAGSPLMEALGALPFLQPGDSILYTSWATLVMLTYEHLPIMIVILFAASERIDDELLRAARSLGAGRLRVFATVVAPLTAPSFLAAFALVFVPVAGSFVEAQILGGPDGLLLGNVIADQVSRVNNPGLAAVLSLLLVGAVLACLGLVAAGRAAWRSRPSAAPLPRPAPA